MPFWKVTLVLHKVFGSGQGQLCEMQSPALLSRSHLWSNGPVWLQMLRVSCTAEYLVKGELIPTRIAQVLRRGGAGKVERGECFGKQLRGQWHGSLSQACRAVSLASYHHEGINILPLLFFFLFLLSHSVNKIRLHLGLLIALKSPWHLHDLDRFYTYFIDI